MADAERIKRIKRSIVEIAGRPRSVRFSEIDQVIDQLALAGYPVKKKEFKHGYSFKIGPLQPFSICDHHKGSSQLKQGYVSSFLDAMIQLGLYED